MAVRRLPGLCLGAALAAGGGATPASGGAWTQKESHGSFYLQSIATWSSDAFDGASKLYATDSYDKVDTQLFIEFGASDWLTLLCAPQLLSVDVGGAYGGSYFGVGYTDLGARLRLVEGDNFVISSQVVGRIPGASPSDGVAAIGYVNGELDLRVLAGITFEMLGRPAFLNLEIADRLRFGDPPNEWRFDATLGVRVAPQWQVLLQSFNVVSEGSGQGVVFDVSYEYYKVQMAAMLDLSEQTSLLVGVVSTYYARNAPQENGLVFAALYRY